MKKSGVEWVKSKANSISQGLAGSSPAPDIKTETFDSLIDEQKRQIQGEIEYANNQYIVNHLQGELKGLEKSKQIVLNAIDKHLEGCDPHLCCIGDLKKELGL